MAAGEDQLQPLVGKRPLLHLVLHGLWNLEQACLRDQGAITAKPVDRSVACRRDQPRGRIRRSPVARPPLCRNCKRLLRGFLGEIEVAEEADQRGDNTPPLVPKDLFDQRSTMGRTSTAPPMCAAGTREATSIAASRSSAS